LRIHRWGRYMGDGLDFDGAKTYMAYGTRGAGKSTLLEDIGLNFIERKLAVLDLFGSRDGESLAWLRSDIAKDLKVLLIHGDNTSVTSSWDSKPVSKYSLDDLNHYDLIISSSPLYSSIDAEYQQINDIINLVYKRVVFTRIVYVVIREAANLLYSRLKVSNDQTLAKAEMTYFIREARHCGFSLGLDTQKLTSIDIDIRITIDYLFFKSLGLQGLPQDLRWLYSTYLPMRLQKMRPEEFLLLTSAGSHGIGTFPYHTWHKHPGEDILTSVGIKVEHSEEMVDSKPDYRVGDTVHSDIIKMKNEGRPHSAVAEQQNVSKSTVYSQLKYHNEHVQKSGECDKCRRAKSELAKSLVSSG
jgi:hypothetical protein